MRLVTLVACSAFIFNILFVLLTWPMGEGFSFGNDTLARLVFNARVPINTVLIIGFITAYVMAFFKTRNLRPFATIAVASVLALSMMVGWYFDADRLFHIKSDPILVSASEVDYPESLEVLTVTSISQSHAYPIQFLAYHHLVTDTIAATEFDITYCVLVDAENVFHHQEHLNFELTAARHNNTVYRDSETDTWWQQQTGMAIAGEKQGEHIPSYPSFRMTFGEWRRMFPEGKVMIAQPGYESLYDRFFPWLWPEES